MNRNTIISIILGLILIITVGGYFVFYKSGPVTPAPETASDGPGALPGGTPKPNTINGFNVTPTSTINNINNDQLKSTGGFYQLTSKAIGGATNEIYSGTTSDRILFAEKATGNIYRVSVADRQPIRLTNTTIPRIRQVWWGQTKTNPSALIYYTDKNGADHWFNATVKIASTSDGELVGADLDQDITSLDNSPDGKNIVYLRTENQGVTGTTFNIESGKRTVIFKSAFRDWNISWDSPSAIIINAKPAAGIPGLAITLNPQTTQTKPLLENINGLTTLLSPDGKKVLSSASGSFSNIDLSVYTLATKNSANINLNTLPEKCAWSKDNIHIYCGVPNPLPPGNYPDEWYSGEVGFSDTLWKINTDTGETTILINPQLENLNQPIDAYQPFLGPNEKYLYLTNKHDLTLWALDLGQEL